MSAVRQVLGEALRPVLALAVALAVGFAVIAAAGLDPVEAYRVLFRNGFLTRNSLLETLERTIPLTFTGLAVTVAFRTGAFNIGVEGQLYLGAMAGFWVGWAFKLPPGLHAAVAILAGAAAGALWAVPPALARARWQADEVVSTMMLNYIAILFTSFLVARPFKDTTAGAQQTWPVQPSAELLRLFTDSRVHVGIFLALAMAVAVYVLLFRTARGYELRMVGMNPAFAEYAGISTGRAMLFAMLLSGALGGMAGAVEILGIHRRFVDLFSPGYGFDGIVVALMAKNHPAGVVLAAFLYGGLKTGAAYMDRLTDVPKELNDALQGLMIFFVAAEGLFAFARENGALRRKLGRLSTWLGRGGKAKEVA